MVFGYLFDSLRNVTHTCLQGSISLLATEKRLKLVSNAAQQTEEQTEEVLSDRDVDQLVGTTDACQLPVSNGAHLEFSKLLLF